MNNLKFIIQKQSDIVNLENAIRAVLHCDSPQCAFLQSAPYKQLRNSWLLRVNQMVTHDGPQPPLAIGNSPFMLIVHNNCNISSNSDIENKLLDDLKTKRGGVMIIVEIKRLSVTTNTNSKKDGIESDNPPYIRMTKNPRLELEFVQSIAKARSERPDEEQKRRLLFSTLSSKTNSSMKVSTTIPPNHDQVKMKSSNNMIEESQIKEIKEKPSDITTNTTTTAIATTTTTTKDMTLEEINKAIELKRAKKLKKKLQKKEAKLKREAISISSISITDTKEISLEEDHQNAKEKQSTEEKEDESKKQKQKQVKEPQLKEIQTQDDDKETKIKIKEKTQEPLQLKVMDTTTDFSEKIDSKKHPKKLTPEEKAEKLKRKKRKQERKAKRQQKEQEMAIRLQEEKAQSSIPNKKEKENVQCFKQEEAIDEKTNEKKTEETNGMNEQVQPIIIERNHDTDEEKRQKKKRKQEKKISFEESSSMKEDEEEKEEEKVKKTEDLKKRKLKENKDDADDKKSDPQVVTSIQLKKKKKKKNEDKKKFKKIMKHDHNEEEKESLIIKDELSIKKKRKLNSIEVNITEEPKEDIQNLDSKKKKRKKHEEKQVENIQSEVLSLKVTSSSSSNCLNDKMKGEGKTKNIAQNKNSTTLLPSSISTSSASALSSSISKTHHPAYQYLQECKAAVIGFLLQERILRQIIVNHINNRTQDFPDPITSTLVLMASSPIQMVFCEEGLLLFKTAHLPIFPYTSLGQEDRDFLYGWLQKIEEAHTHETYHGCGKFSVQVGKGTYGFLPKKDLLLAFVYLMLNQGEIQEKVIQQRLTDIIIQRFLSSISMQPDEVTSVMEYLWGEAPMTTTALNSI